MRRWLRAQAPCRHDRTLVWTTLWDHGNQPLQWGIAVGASLVAAAFDVASRRIPNLLTGPVLLAGLVWATIAGGWGGLADSAAAAGALMLPFLVLFVFAGGGAGDAKLMAAVGSWLGLVNGLVALGAVCLAGLVMAVAFALARGRMLAVFRNMAIIIYGLLFILASPTRQARSQLAFPATEQMQTMPYGVAVFLGMCLAAAATVLWRA